MDNGRDYSDFFIAACAAEGYHRTAEMIWAQVKDGFEFSWKFSSPYVVNLGLACELYMKALILYHNKERTTGHDLNELYKRLDKHDQSLIDEEYNSSPFMKQYRETTQGDSPCLYDFIEQHQKPFVDYRYPYEKNENSCLYYSLLNAVADALSKVCAGYWNTYNQDTLCKEEPDHAD
jgi:HEPN domain-containing protein